MDFEQVFNSALLPAIISIGVGVVGAQRQKRIEFDYSFHNYILEKRKKAYETIERILSEFVFVHYNDGTKSLRFYDMGSHSIGLVEMNNLILTPIYNSMWLTEDMIDRLQDLNKVIVAHILECQVMHKPHAEIAMHIVEVGCRDYEKVLFRMLRVRNQYFADLIELDNVRAFRDVKGLKVWKEIKETDALKSKY